MLLAMVRSFTHIGKGQLGFVLHTITGFHRPSLTHYYGFICHLTSALDLEFLLESKPLTDN